MAFAMSLPRTKRVKHYEPDGTEIFQEEDRWSLVRTVHSNQQDTGQERDEDSKVGAQPSSNAPVLPLEALEKLQHARGEINMMLDLIDNLEAQQYMGIANVPPQKSTLQQLTRQRDLRLQAKAHHLKDAAERLRNGAGALRAHLALEDCYFDSIAQLARNWHIRPSPEFSFSSGAAPYQADLRIRVAQYPAEATVLLDLGRTSDGHVQVNTKEGTAVIGTDRAEDALREWQTDLLWSGLRIALQKEAQASSSSSAAQAFAIEVLQTTRCSANPDLQELGALLMSAYLASLVTAESTGKQPKLLPRANAWLRHRWFVHHTLQSLAEQASRLEAGVKQTVRLEAVEVAGPSRSVIRLWIGAWAVLLIVRVDSMEVRGAGKDAGGGSRWANAGVIANVGKQEVDSILLRLLQEK